MIQRNKAIQRHKARAVALDSGAGRPGQLFLAAAATLALAIAAVAAMDAKAATGADDQPVPHSDSVGAAVGDTAITAKVKANYMGDSRLKSSDVHVTTTNGVVTLTGSAAGSDAKDAAEELAKQVDGVKSVDDQLTTGSDGDVHQLAKDAKKVGTDGWITTKVKGEILSDSLNKGSKVHVSTRNGVVMLSGALPNQDAIDHVKDEAGRIQGVKSVDVSGLKVATSND